MKNCPVCGSKLNIKKSFKGRSMYRNKRETYVCSCGFSTIKETLREERIRSGSEI